MASWPVLSKTGCLCPTLSALDTLLEKDTALTQIRLVQHTLVSKICRPNCANRKTHFWTILGLPILSLSLALALNCMLTHMHTQTYTHIFLHYILGGFVFLHARDEPRTSRIQEALPTTFETESLLPFRKC